MVINFLSLKDFRNYSQKNFLFDKGVTLIVGPNASGKTNVLEAVYLLSRGKSFRAKLEREMINYQSQISNIKCQMFKDRNKEELEIILTRGEIQGKIVAKKLFKINGVGKKAVDFIGNLKAVMFRPENIDIILGSPNIRRDYLDSVLELTDREYRVCNLVYRKGLRQRNKLLDFIRNGTAKLSQLEYWNRLLIKNGEIITRKRAEFVSILNFHFSIKKIFIEYLKSVITEERIKKYQTAEIALGATLVGPHRDDIKFEMQNSRSETKRDLALFGSRGEQRMAVLALKIAELIFIEEKTREKPILLLDDIFSELDRSHRYQVIKLIDNYQTILTVTEESLVNKKNSAKIKIIEIDKNKHL